MSYSLNPFDLSYRHVWSLATRHPIVFSCKLSCSHPTRLNGMPATETSTYSNQLSPTSTFQTWHRASFMKHDATMSWKIALKKIKMTQIFEVIGCVNLLPDLTPIKCCQNTKSSPGFLNAIQDLKQFGINKAPQVSTLKKLLWVRKKMQGRLKLIFQNCSSIDYDFLFSLWTTSSMKLKRWLLLPCSWITLNALEPRRAWAVFHGRCFDGCES